MYTVISILSMLFLVTACTPHSELGVYVNPEGNTQFTQCEQREAPNGEMREYCENHDRGVW